MRYKIRAVDLDPQFQTGIPVKVMVAVTLQNDKPVEVNDANKEIVILKIPNNKNLSEIYMKHELANNGTVLVSIPTSKKDESGFILKVHSIHFVFIFSIFHQYSLFLFGFFFVACNVYACLHSSTHFINIIIFAGKVHGRRS